MSPQTRNLPKSLENYAQEIGRAGRDGEPSTCEMFVCLTDLNVLENFVYGDTPSLASVRSLVSEVFSHGEELELSLYDLSLRHDIRQLVVRTLLSYLELDGYLREGDAAPREVQKCHCIRVPIRGTRSMRQSGGTAAVNLRVSVSPW